MATEILTGAAAGGGDSSGDPPPFSMRPQSQHAPGGPNSGLMRGFVSGVRQAAAAVSGGGAGGVDAGARVVVCGEGALVRALARRPERTGSKLLKKDYKLSKRIK